MDVKRSLHVVVRSTHAQGPRALIKNSELVRHQLRKSAKRFRIRVYALAIHWDHIHLSIRGRRRIDLQNFFRVFCGHLAQEILRQFPLRRSPSPKWRRQFWNDLVFTRTVDWGRDFKNVSAYIVQNTLEAHGFIPIQPRNHRNTS